MKAVVKMRREPGAIEICEVDLKPLGPTEVRIQTVGANICGSDIGAYHYVPAFHYIKPPFIMGHEFAGTVVEVGSGVERVRVGDRVYSEAVLWCGHCTQCRVGRTNTCQNFTIIGLHTDGGMCELATFDERYAHHLPDGMTLEQATYVEPTSVGVHAVTGHDNRFDVDDLVVVAGVGPIGLLTAQTVRATRTSNIITTGLDIDEHVRFPVARKLGFEPVNVQRTDLAELVVERTDGRGADVFIEASGSPEAMVQGVEVLKKGGLFIMIGIQGGDVTMVMAPLVRKEVRIQGTISGTWKDFEAAARLIAGGDVQVDPLMTKFPMERVEEGFAAMKARSIVKAMIVPE